MKRILLPALIALVSLSSCGPKDGDYRLEILTTNDLHGSYFDSTYVGDRTEPSLLAVKYYADSVRKAAGKDNVIIIDAGDFLQGDNAAYYYNYVETGKSHIASRMFDHIGYDVIVGGNHDVETGHPVYDRVAAELKKAGIPYLSGNAIRNDDGGRYFPEYTILKKGGLKVAVLGYNNANIKAWLNESLWSGTHYTSLLPLVQEDVDRIRAKEKPDLVIVAAHTGTGSGNRQVLESQGLDLFNSLKGVDAVICAHDHRPFVDNNGSSILLNSGSHARNLGHGSISLTIDDGKVVSKTLSAELITVDADKSDAEMRASFQSDYDAVKEFTVRKVGELSADMNSRDALTGMSDYVNFIHTVSLGCSPAEISVAAPISTNTFIKAGDLIYNDLFSLYQYENQLFVLTMSGQEIKDYLEVSYDQWIQTATKPGDHVLNIQDREDPRNHMKRWSFRAATYNFDSMAGLNYTVDVSKPYGERIAISSMADGSAFETGRTYNVAMTSYRASGGGGLLPKIGVDTDNIDDRVVNKYPEIRELMYEYLKENGSINPEVTGDPKVIGHWEFIPEDIAKEGIAADMQLLYGNRP